MIDTHCHLDAPEFDGDRGEVLARARAAGVTDVVPAFLPVVAAAVAAAIGAAPAEVDALTTANARASPHSPSRPRLRARGSG